MGNALDILKYIRNNDYIMDFLDKADINEAIKELEEAMKPKTCVGCKWLLIGKYCTLPIGACIRKSDDYFEQKDNA